jgi:deoxyribonuclease V
MTSSLYVAGFLAFIELPLVLKAIEKITVEPDIFIFDGNGYLH